MDFGNESPYYSSSPSSTSSQSQSPSTPCNPNSPSDSLLHAHAQALSSSHKRKTGRKKFRETRHPIYRGVRQRNGNKWVCEVREPNKKSRIWLGTYPTPEMAARAHDVAALALKGSSAVFNFPHLASLIPVVKSTSAADIREAAKAFTLTNPSSSTNNLWINTNPCLVELGKSQERVLVDDNIFKNTCTQEKIMNNDDESKSMFIDEEALYNMPGLLDSMAEGLLITPPSMKKTLDWDDVDCEIDLTLWTD
ncbi:dehydration-responsive element-binding protein 1B-like [Gastrolobium bilobum]|uniref:dehydration-responsive element-binding protein 1B-like n=1 Tax=Gastrolobium bilobum TaxID=150636 RepID=UPI002AB26559|nr:dehydration-responsive element-binding protein 1B-like [Gastrolobium bilobum]